MDRYTHVSIHIYLSLCPIFFRNLAKLARDTIHGRKQPPQNLFGHNRGVISAVWDDLLPHESPIPPRDSGVVWGDFGKEYGGFLMVFLPFGGGGADYPGPGPIYFKDFSQFGL